LAQPSGVFIVWLSSGGIYELAPEDLPFEFTANVHSCRLGETQAYFVIELADGATYEVPWDLVLHVCEPAYEYHISDAVDSRSTAERIGQRVRDRRLSAGMKQARLAELSHLKEANLSRLEKGRHLPSLETLERVAGALGVSVASLIAE
jgi:DNA-binding XRE family transcriptional regulator